MGQVCIGWRSLRFVCPNLTAAEAKHLAPILGKAMMLAGATSQRRAAMLIAQWAHECDMFRTRQEYASGAAYEWRRDLGNTRRGDGRRYKGRGYIQITGRVNYRDATWWLRQDWPRVKRLFGLQRGSCPDLEREPWIVAERATWAAIVSALWWKRRGCNAFCDRNDFLGLTRRINGGTNGLAHRQLLHRRARVVARYLVPKER